MKYLPCLLPLCAAAGVGSWIYIRHHQAHSDTSALVRVGSESESGLVAPRVSDSALPPVQSTSGNSITLAIEKKDWKALSAIFDRKAEAGKAKDFESLEPIRDYIGTLNAASIHEAVDALGPPSDKVTLIGLECELIKQWIRMDPEAALNHYAGRLMKPDFQCKRLMEEGLKNLAGKSPDRAISWLNELTAKGGFDDVNLIMPAATWMTYKAALVHGLLSGNLDAAIKQVEDCTAAERAKLFFYLRSDRFTKEELPGYGAICRRFLDDEDWRDALDTLCSQAIYIERGGLVAVDRIFDQMGAPPVPRAKVATVMLRYHLEILSKDRKVTTEDIRQIREWLVKSGVKDLDRWTGWAIGRVAQYSPAQLDETFGMLESYRRSGAGEALVYGFLGSPAVWKRETDCRAMFETIRNEAWRKEILEDCAPKQ